MQENNNSQQPLASQQLAGRLYKNYRSSNNLRGVIQANTFENRDLIPKISLKKKEINLNQPSITFQNGKMLLSNSVSNRNIGNSNIVYQDMSSIQQNNYHGNSTLMDQSLDNNILQGLNCSKVIHEKGTQESRLFKDNTYSGSVMDKTQIQRPQKGKFSDHDPLTPYDFINLIKTYPDMADEFCYLNKKSHAYDFYIVEFDKRNLKEYMTISKRGITHYQDGVGEFMTINQWKRDANMFNKLRNIQFFKQYKKWKNFSVWKKYMRRNIMRDCQMRLNDNLFQLDHNLNRSLLEIRGISLHISQVDYLELQFSETQNLDQYRVMQDDFIQKQMDQKFNLLESAIRDLVVGSCKNSLIAYKNDNRIEHRDAENPNIEENIKTPLLVGDETNKEMPFTQEATTRIHYKRLRKYIKLIDYIVFNSKIDLITNCGNKIFEYFTEFNEAAWNRTKNFKGFLNSKCTLLIHDQGLSFKPSMETLMSVYMKIMENGISKVCQQQNQLIFSSFLSVYTQVTPDNIADLTLDLQSTVYDHPNYKDSLNRIQKALVEVYDCTEQYSQFLIPFLQIYDENHAQTIESLESTDITQYRDLILKYQGQDVKFQNIEPKFDLGFILFDNAKLKDKIKNCASVCLRRMTQALPIMLHKRSEQLLSILQGLSQKLTWSISEENKLYVEYFVQFMKDVAQINEQMEEHTITMADLNSLLIILQEFNLRLADNQKFAFQEAQALCNKCRKQIEEAQASYDQNLNKAKKKLDSQVPEFENKTKDLTIRLQNSPVADKKAQINTVVSLIQDMREELQEIQDGTKRIFNQQVHLLLDVKQWEKLEDLTIYFNQVEKLWKGRKEFQDHVIDWSLQQFKKLDINKIEDTLMKLQKVANQCVKELETNECAKIFQYDVQQFQEKFQCLRYLRDEALGQRQWEEIQTLLLPFIQVKDPIPFHDLEYLGYNLKYIIENQIYKYNEQLGEIVLKANKEAELIKMLNQVMVFWKQSLITIIPYKDKQDVYILGNNEEMIGKLDDSIMTLNNIMASRFVEQIRQKVEQQQKLFYYLQELLEEWQSHQKNWIYLEPIFSGNVSHMGLVKEAKMFQNSDASWKKMMKKANDLNQCKFWADDCHNRNTINLLKANNNNFDIIQKALEDYLERKREQFQRFFFISNDELLEILSKAKKPPQMLPHLLKVFENIKSLKFDGDVAEYMVSSEGEEVLLKNCVCRGEVEDWMRILEESMKYSIQQVFRKCIMAYEAFTMVRNEWVLQFACQAILSIDSLYWTKMTEEQYLIGPETTEDDPPGSLVEWAQTIIVQLEEITKLIIGELTKIQRNTLVALVTQDVHYRDIIETMAEQNVENISDFWWQQQLRFYWEDEVFYAKQVRSDMSYGYEYLGAMTRLVITPLTDRCWMTITGALQIRLGANPMGPAGTGKTESCKDLAKVLGRYCIVFNCSDQVNVKMMEKLLTGLAFTGSWTCLDEFNRIDIEVLSVVAQQCLQIREALLENKVQFQFGAKMINLHTNIGIFITMNPGYAGRTELPDNLKVLFRPISMMVPNYQLIAEIMLYAEGFGNAKDLSRKMTKLYKLSSEQLSQQDHYDFGMRAVKSVLVMAGSLKRANPDQNEDIVLIRALRDSNIPKFLSQDIPLFNAIVQDLFPGVQIPLIENKDLQDEIDVQIKEIGLISVPTFQTKVFQLHDTLKVRFGVMMVGATMTGKSKIIEVLKNSYTSLRLNKNDNKYNEIESAALNPKSISMQELYGDYDAITQAWTDGLANIILRKYVQMEGLVHKWIIFDGPVDAIWIENMNSVLDDSMTLCLSNGERIKLNHSMKMLFEVADLAVASPATVSRCGMVFMDENVLGIEAPIRAFFQQNFKSLSEKTYEYILNQILNLYESSLHFIRKFCKEPIQTNDKQLVLSICRHIDMILRNDKNALVSVCSDHSYKKASDKLLIFGMFWGLGSTLSDECISKFEKYLSENIHSTELPKGSVYDNFLSFQNKHDGEWISWMNVIPEFEYDMNKSYFDLIVPTQDTVCYSWILQRHINLLNGVFFTGVSGTSKTIIVEDTFNKLVKDEVCTGLMMAFSSQTNACSTQLLIESKLTAQRKKGINYLVPPPNKKFLIFVDDINMPQTEYYGAQPPIELLRQVVDFKQVYDRSQWFMKQFDDTVLVAAASPPGGGRSPLTPRFSRHFLIYNIHKSSEESLTLIFNTILNGFLNAYKFKPEIIMIGEQKKVVKATLDLYNLISQDLLPTPAKSHYTFNLRDVSKVFQGILMSKPQKFQSIEQFAYLWVHECQRVFHDRLINQDDQNWFQQTACKLVFINFGLDWKQDKLFKEPLFFGDFMNKGAEAENKFYEQITDQKKLVKVVTNYMEEDTKLKLVLFKDALDHLLRITRVLRQQRGHYMIVGVGGSGKKSLTTLAAALSESNLMMIEPRKNYGKKEFREDILKMMITAGVENKEVLFLFPDTDILQESFLEDVNSLINSGEIPGLLKKEDIEQIVNGLSEEIRVKKIVQTPYSFFVQRVRSQMHIVLAMSPVGELLRQRMRMFPALINCCTIDWLQPWPEDALYSVAQMFLESLDYDGINQELINALSEMCMYVHLSVNESCQEFLQLLKRKVYTTPKSYLDLINGYKQLLKMKKDEIAGNVMKLSNGLQKLASANETIEGLQAQLVEMQPLLEKKTIEQDALISKLEVDKAEANQVKIYVEQEGAEVREKSIQVMGMKEEADKILKAAMPTLKAAVEALNTLNRSDISEIKANNNPHILIKFTLECVAVLLEEKQDWDSIKKMMSDASFLNRLKTLKAEEINKNTQTKIKSKIASNPEFNPDVIKGINVAACSLCLWVRAVSDFTDIYKEISTKQAYVAEMDKELQKANALLAEKESALKQVVDKVDKLEKLYIANRDEKQRLDDEINLCEARLNRANELTVGLADEQVRWKETVILLSQDLAVVLGNVFLAGASIAYYGPFTGNFREKLVEKWILKAQQLKIPCSEQYSLQGILGNAVLFRDWNSKGLPSDSISLNNGLLVTYCSSYPLMIDPQFQANSWIKKMQANNGIKITKMNADNLIKTVEMCLRMGTPLLIEDIGEQLDPMLEPLLTKQFTNVNGRQMVKVGESDIEYDPKFKIFFTTKLPNPSYLPEIFIRVTVINFTVTTEGLEEQLLGEVVSIEMPEVELARQDLVLSIALGRSQLKQNEDKILDLLSNSKGMILDDVALIESLKSSKEVSKKVSESLQIAEEKQKEIDVARANYLPVAIRGSLFYFVVADLNLIDPMYQFSLSYYQRLFNLIIENTEPCKDLTERVISLMDNITFIIYENVCRGLFNNHKRIFSFLVSTSIEIKAKIISAFEWKAFIKGIIQMGQLPELPQQAQFSQQSFAYLVSLSKECLVYAEIIADMKLKIQEWNNWQKLENIQCEPLPRGFEEKLTKFQKLHLIKIFKESKTIYAIGEYVKNAQGEKYASQIAPTLDQVFNDTNYDTPLIFICTPGADPLLNIMRFSKEKKIAGDKFNIISLGQGQGIIAEKAIDMQIKNGGWVLLQNCHLGKSFMPQLEKKLESLSDPEFSQEVNKSFRLFLTSMPCNYFPVSILQNSMKLTIEPPKGIKNNMFKMFNELSDDRLEIPNQQDYFKKLTFSLSLFHAVIQERRRFGPLGWNIKYEFNDSDLDTTLNLLRSFLESANDVPWDALRYVTGEINYGGRVTDEWDRRLLSTILQQYCCSQLLTDNHAFSESGTYFTPKDGNLEFYKQIILKYPEAEAPEIFGMNNNANINFQMKESQNIIETILNIQPRDSGGSGGKSSDEEIESLCVLFNDQLPQQLHKEQVDGEEQKVDFMDALEVFLTQESERFNILLKLILNSLKKLVKAIKGEEVMSSELDLMYQSFLNNQVPQMWVKKSYPSLKPLAGWFEDLKLRCEFLQNWLKNGKPLTYWMSSFYYPQGFLTSVLQNFARKSKLPIDLLQFKFKFTSMESEQSVTTNPQEGVYVHGLFMEGAKYDFQKGHIVDSDFGVMFTIAPVIWFIPVEGVDKNSKDYTMPVYKTTNRAGTLSTTGASTNFIIAVQCPSIKPSQYWILNSAALFCALPY